MTVDVEIQIEGLAEMDQALSAFTDKVAKKALDSAISYATSPIVKEVKRLAAVAPEPHEMKYGNEYVEVQPGLLKSAIRRRKLKKRELEKLEASAGQAIYIGKGTKQKLYPRYWHFVEFGTQHSTPTPYLRPAFDTKREEAIQRFKTKLAQNIESQQAINNAE